MWQRLNSFRRVLREIKLTWLLNKMNQIVTFFIEMVTILLFLGREYKIILFFTYFYNFDYKIHHHSASRFENIWKKILTFIIDIFESRLRKKQKKISFFNGIPQNGFSFSSAGCVYTSTWIQGEKKSNSNDLVFMKKTFFWFYEASKNIHNN